MNISNVNNRNFFLKATIESFIALATTINFLVQKNLAMKQFTHHIETDKILSFI